MAIVCNCASCGKTLKVDDKAAGKRVRCPGCNQPVAVPMLGAPQQLPPAPQQRAAPPPPRMPPPNMGQPAYPQQMAPQSYPQPMPSPVPVQPVMPPQQQPQFPPPPATPVQVPRVAPVAAIPVPQAAPVQPVAHVQPEVPVQSSGFPIVADSGGAPRGTAARRPTGAKSGASPKKNQQTMLLVGGGVAGLVLVLLVVVGLAMSGGSAPAKQTAQNNKSSASNGDGRSPSIAAPTAPSSGPKGTLVFDWEPSDRGSSAVMIDGKKIKVPASGPFEVELPTGSHDLVVQRRGYEIVRKQIDLPADSKTEFAPEWVSVQIASATPSAEATAGVAASPDMAATTGKPKNSGTNFAIGSAVVPRGFEGGWMQSIPEASSRAESESKDLVILFGSSDGSVPTIRLAKALRDAGLPGGALAEKYVPVVIDYPRTRSGGNNVLDWKQNIDLAKDYGIEELQELPVLVVADARGRPYGVKRDWGEGIDEGADIINELAAEKEKRDSMLKLAGDSGSAERFAGVIEAGNWILQRKLSTCFAVEFALWFEDLKSSDPENEKGAFEVALEGHLLVQLRGVKEGDVVDLANRISVLDPWLKKSFKDPDRGARLHVIVGSLLAAMGDEASGLKHMKRAVAYEPKEKELRERIAVMKRLLANENVLGNGTGFVVAEGGYILTNRHVVEGDGKVMVRVPNVKDPVPAIVVKIDEELDCALIKVDFPDDFKPVPLPLSDSSVRLSVGVAAYGYPAASTLGEGLKATTGTVSSLPSQETEDMILLDVRINPGNSGGPLCDKKGNVVGMVTAKTGANRFQDSYGLAIPAAELQKFLEANLLNGVKLPGANDAVQSDWADVTERVQPAVMLILKVK